MATFPIWIDHDRNFRQVASNLYLGDQDTTGAARWAAIVGMNPYDGTAIDQTRLDDYLAAGRFLFVPMEDGDPIPTETMDAAHRVVGEARQIGNALIHCRAGLSRSASVAYGLLRVQDRLSHEEAMRRIRAMPGLPVPTTLGSARRWAEERLAGR